MESYIILLLVTSEQEDAIQQLFSQKNWHYIKPALTEAVSSRLASISNEIQETKDKTIDDINNLATDYCRNMDFTSIVVKDFTSIVVKSNQYALDEIDTPESKFGAASVSVKLEDTTAGTCTSGSDTEIETYDAALVAGLHVKTDGEQTESLDVKKDPYTEMGNSPSESIADNWEVIKPLKGSKSSKVPKVKLGSKKRYSSYLEMKKYLRKKNASGKKGLGTASKLKLSKGEKADQCPKCYKYFTHSQFIVHEAKDRCQLICCFCKKNFGDNFAKYSRHIRNVHTSSDLTNPQIEDNEDTCTNTECSKQEPSDRDSKDVPVSGSYCCNVCGTSYVSLIRYTKHVEKGNCKQTCGVCGKVYLNNPQNFLIHTRTHSKSLQFPCTHCHKSFVTQAKLHLHMKEHTGGVFTCGKCTMTFRLQSHLTYHWKLAHTSPKKYMCDLCGAVYKSQASLNYHTDTSHSEDRPYTCHICQAKFKVKVTLKAHMNVHSELKNYQCNTCCKYFKTKSLLCSHERRHSRQYTHRCDICSKGFYDKRTLSEHKNTHSGDKPHKCSQCDYACASMSNLIKHTKIHENAPPTCMGTGGSWPNRGPLYPGGGGSYQFPFS